RPNQPLAAKALRKNYLIEYRVSARGRFGCNSRLLASANNDSVSLMRTTLETDDDGEAQAGSKATILCVQFGWRVLADRFAACKLGLHPEKTKIVYCKDANRCGDFAVISFDFLGFQFRARKTMWVKQGRRIFTHGFLPAASPKALKRIGRE